MPEDLYRVRHGSTRDRARPDVIAVAEQAGQDLDEVIRRCVLLEPAQRERLTQICTGPVVTVADLERERVFPVPASARKPLDLSPDLFSSDR